MSSKNIKGLLIKILIISNTTQIFGLSNLSRNDPYPFFSNYYPYSYLSTKQKEHLAMMDYTYPATRWRLSVSGFNQSSDRGRNQVRDTVNLGDMNGRWNMLGLFYDPAMANRLYEVLGIKNCFPPECIVNTCDTDDLPPVVCTPYSSPVPSGCTCYNLITRPELQDPNREFGFFTIPILYRKTGARFETELLLVDKCFDGVGLKVQFGVADVRQTVLALGFNTSSGWRYIPWI